MAARGGERRLDALLLVGESALAGGSVRDAEAGYAGALAEAPPGSPEWQRAVAGLLLVGERYFKGSGLEDAGRVYQLVERTVPGGAEAQFRALAGIGLVAEARGAAEDARRRYQEIARGASDRDLVRWAEARLHGLSVTRVPHTEAAGEPKAAPAPRAKTGAGS